MQIIQKTTRITAQEEVNGVTVMYSYEYEKDQKPQAVSFSTSRKDEEGNYYYPFLGTVTEYDFNVQNSNFQISDIELYKHIHEVCSQLINGKESKDKKETK